VSWVRATKCNPLTHGKSKAADTGKESVCADRGFVDRYRLLLAQLGLSLLFLLNASGASADARQGPGAASALASIPIEASLERVLSVSVGSWRSPVLELFRWDQFPSILIVDTRDFSAQDRLFTRLAYFVEKLGHRGTLMTNAQLAGKHGWTAHDYGPEGLAAFFSAASRVHFPLNDDEVALRSLALSDGIITAMGDEYTAGEGGVLSISRSSGLIERRQLLAHESFHGIFFASPVYSSYCFTLWDSLAPAERQYYTSFLDTLGYDGADRYLAVNEFQAYLMQQPIGYVVSYFERFAAILAGSGVTGAPDGPRIRQTAASLDSFLRSHFGIAAGSSLLAPGH
jgi:hypothetical protein